ncbi:MAG: hypothetical protein KF716_22240, partial [Anaerolineae bacterium]|nr:hypothetical protein [Anaerolineae bacterium]
IAYEPTVYVWHQHRRTMEELQRQMIAYGRAMIVYELQIFFHDHDWRGLWQLAVVLPVYRLRQLVGLLMAKARGKPTKTWVLFRWGVQGNIEGFSAYWQSRQRVKRMGRSAPYQLPDDRP